jgi:ubiquinone/menaquinone biosynthesis C-methylase UbiE
MINSFSTVTEISGSQISHEQLIRMYHRYFWASTFCNDKDILELACGVGQGLGLLSSVARKVQAADIDPIILNHAKNHYGDRIMLDCYDCTDIPLEDHSVDVVIFFEAIYYVEDIDKFLDESLRVLKKGGKLLICSANPALYDFNPSAFSFRYFNSVELQSLLSSKGFEVSTYGYCNAVSTSFSSLFLRFIKRIAVKFDIIPKTMVYKKFLKRIFFGKLVNMPSELSTYDFTYTEPVIIPSAVLDTSHKIIYAVGNKS